MDAFTQEVLTRGKRLGLEYGEKRGERQGRIKGKIEGKLEQLKEMTRRIMSNENKSWVEDNDMKVIYQVCEKLDDGGIRLTLRGTTKKLKHDCGTPIPEPVVEAPVPEAPNADASAEKPKTRR